MSERRAYTISDFCKAFAVGKTGVYAEIKAGRLIARKYGTKTLIAQDDAEKWVANLPKLNTSVARPE